MTWRVRRLQDDLASCEIGRPLRFVPETDSTNAEMTRWIGEGAGHGAAVIADTQTSGRGRLGRPWHSPPGINLYTSVLLAMPDTASARLAPYLAGVAVAEAVGEDIGTLPFLKWPNDVYVLGRKLCGILCEGVAGPRPLVIVGIGININAASDDFPPDLQSRATSMRLAAGRVFELERVAARLYRRLGERYKEFAADTAGVLRKWTELARFPDVAYVVRTADRTIEGRAVGLSKDGALALLDSTDGQEVQVHSGEVLSFRVVDDASGH